MKRGPLFKPFESHKAVALLILLLLTAAASPACNSSRGHGHERRFELRGKVVSVDRAAGTVRVDHEAVEGLMDAMVMDFKVKDRDVLSVAEAGDRIQATLVVADDGAYLENPAVTKGTPNGSDPAPAVGPKAGDPVPDVQLLNQDDKAVRLSAYKGRALLLTFIYARCPLADYCPLISQRFATIDRALREDAALRDRTHLLSVSIDPEHDTPKVLRSYGGAYTEQYASEKFDHWEFATGDPAEIRRLAQFFGLEYFPDKDQIVHSLRTAVIDPDGRVYKVYPGNGWQTSEIIGDLRALLSPNG